MQEGFLQMEPVVGLTSLRSVYAYQLISSSGNESY